VHVTKNRKALDRGAGRNLIESNMSTLLEIEKAAELLPRDQQRELFGFLLERLRGDGPPLVAPRIFSVEEMKAWMVEDEADLRDLAKDS
jgi:hypothetical protein